MTMTREELSATLADVRRAYRLIHAYQRRVWDLLRVIDQTAARGGLAFDHWQPMNVNAPPKAKTKFFEWCWAWDFVPAYDLGCEWVGKAGKKVVKRVFVIVKADTGYKQRGNKEPDAADFPPAEACATEVHLGLWEASPASPDWEAAWAELTQKHTREEDKTYELTLGGVHYKHRFVRVNVADLVDEAAVTKLVHRPIEAWVET